MYAIVDIETTGGYASSHGITEIAIILHNGTNEEGRYQALINPGMTIPRHITALTGITNEMLMDAPRFEEIAPRVFNLLKGRVFVAHNVNFDYSFIHRQLQDSGFDLNTRKLCTVRMSRKIIPGLPRYSLGALSRHFDIVNGSRHRAMGDAEATSRLFSILLANDASGVVAGMLKQGSRETYLPMHLQAADVEALPYTPGVYYFHDQKGKVIYVGKAINLRKRVTSHFSNNAPSRRKQELLRLVHRISFEETGSNFMACILESIEIRKLWPAFNQSQKRFEPRYGLYTYEDLRGFIQIVVGTRKKGDRPVYSFSLLAEGQAIVRKLADTFGLCHRLCGLSKGVAPCVMSNGLPCSGDCNNTLMPETYNQKVAAAMQSLLDDLPSFALLEKGRNGSEQGVALMERGVFWGYTYVPIHTEMPDLAVLKTMAEPCADNSFLRAMMIREASLYPQKVRIFADT